MALARQLPEPEWYPAGLFGACITHENDVNGNVAPKCNVAQLNVTPNCTNESVNEAQNHGESEDKSDPERKSLPVPTQPVTHSNFLFTAENIRDQYSRCVNVVNTLGENLNPTLDKNVVTQPYQRRH